MTVLAGFIIGAVGVLLLVIALFVALVLWVAATDVPGHGKW